MKAPSDLHAAPLVPHQTVDFATHVSLRSSSEGFILGFLQVKEQNEARYHSVPYLYLLQIFPCIFSYLHFTLLLKVLTKTVCANNRAAEFNLMHKPRLGTHFCAR